MKNVPLHIALIPDGNRRFAKRLMKNPWKGHEWGVKKLNSFLGWCRDAGIKLVTVYALSLENINRRPKGEISYLYSLAKKEIMAMLKSNSFVFKNKVRVSFFGSIGLLPEDLQASIKKITEKTAGFSSFLLNIGIAYGGRQEIVSAAKRLASDFAAHKLGLKSIDENVFKKYLQTNGFPDPDLIIRTGGEKRLSNFLLFQSAYSELAFVDSLWPELTKERFLSVISDFSARERRMGG